MSDTIYTLPTIEFIGGETNTLRWRLWHSTPGEEDNHDHPFDANGCQVYFSMTDFSAKYGEPEITKRCEIIVSETGLPNIATVTLNSTETKHLSGKHLYQLTVLGPEKDAEIPGYGIIRIYRNIDKKIIDNAVEMAYLRA